MKEQVVNLNHIAEICQLTPSYELRIVPVTDTVYLKQMYQRISRDMYVNGFRIWDYQYPCCVIPEDIQKGRLFGAYEYKNGLCRAAFALTHGGKDYTSIAWHSGSENAVYCERIAVDLTNRGMGLGVKMYRAAAEIAMVMKADSLRALVADCNKPAMCLCIKSGMKLMPGVYIDSISVNRTIIEMGYELITDTRSNSM